MATSSEQKELNLNKHFQALDDLLEDGPEDDQAAAFLREVLNEARALLGVLESLTEADVDEIWQEDEEGVEV